MDPFTQAMLLQGGAGIIGGIGSYLGGGQQRRDQKWGRGKLQSMYGQDFFDPHALATMRANSFRSQLAPLAGAADKRFGLDSGRAWQDLLWKYGNLAGDQRALDTKENAVRRSGRDERIASYFYGGQ